MRGLSDQPKVRQPAGRSVSMQPAVTSHLWSSSRPGSPLALKGLFLGYNDLQDGFEELWNTWLGAGKGIWDSSADRSGACGGLASPLEILSFLSKPADQHG